MNNYILADIKRISHKKSFLAMIGAYIALFCMMMFIYFNPTFTADAYIAKTETYLSLFPLFVGLSVFLSVFYDDFKSKSMQIAIGYGIQRYKIVLSKILESLLLFLGVMLCVGVLILFMPNIMGLHLDHIQVVSIIFSIVTELLRAIGYICISSIPVFYTQNAVNGTIFYVLLSSKSIMIFATMILGQDIFINTVGDLTQYLYTSQLYAIRSAFLQNGIFETFTFILAVAIYIVLPISLSVVSFKKKELEF